MTILKGFVPVGSNTKVQPNVMFGKGRKIKIGSHCQINENVKLQRVDIGDFVMIAPGVTILGMSHHFDRIDIPMVEQGETETPTGKVEDDVWIGTNAIIMPGITIGKGCIVGAGTVVTKDCLPYGIYAGVPARRIKEREAKPG